MSMLDHREEPGRDGGGVAVVDPSLRDAEGARDLGARDRHLPVGRHMPAQVEQIDPRSIRGLASAEHDAFPLVDAHTHAGPLDDGGGTSSSSCPQSRQLSDSVGACVMR
jgi:hypothetical protein